MKSHISATIDKQLLDDVERYRKQERRSRSQIIELALEKLLDEQALATETEIVTTPGEFKGSFKRAETYER